MTTQIKLDEKLAELSMADVRLLILGNLCHDGKIDCEKLAALADVKKTSARANYWRAKNNLLALMDKKEESVTQPADFKPEDAAAPKALLLLSVARPRSPRPTRLQSTARLLPWLPLSPSLLCLLRKQRKFWCLPRTKTKQRPLTSRTSVMSFEPRT